MEKTSARSVLLVDRRGRRIMLKSLIKAILYLTSIGSLPKSSVEEMVRDRERLINGMRVYYS